MTSMHGPDSLTIRLAGDLRVGLLGGRTFVMQVAHPAVGAGVDQFSKFRSDPWKRIEQITQSGIRYLYRGEQAGFEEGRRLRRIHQGIQGVDRHGRAYHSLDPDVYGWVHFVFFDSIVTAHALFAEPLTRAQQERLFEEWRQGGRVFGLRDEDMPASVDDYWRVHADAIERTLEYNPVMDWILRGEQVPKPPNLAWLPDALWALALEAVGEAPAQAHPRHAAAGVPREDRARAAVDRARPAPLRPLRPLRAPRRAAPARALAHGSGGAGDPERLARGSGALFAASGMAVRGRGLEADRGQPPACEPRRTLSWSSRPTRAARSHEGRSPLSVKIASGRPASRTRARTPGARHLRRWHRALRTPRHLRLTWSSSAQRVAPVPVARSEVPLEVGGPDAGRLRCDRFLQRCGARCDRQARRSFGLEVIEPVRTLTES